MSRQAIRAVPAPKLKRGAQYNQPGALHGLGARVTELGAAVRVALAALDSGHPAVAREVLAAVELPDVS